VKTKGKKINPDTPPPSHPPPPPRTSVGGGDGRVKNKINNLYWNVCSILIGIRQEHIATIIYLLIAYTILLLLCESASHTVNSDILRIN